MESILSPRGSFTTIYLYRCAVLAAVVVVVVVVVVVALWWWLLGYMHVIEVLEILDCTFEIYSLLISARSRCVYRKQLSIKSVNMLVIRWFKHTLMTMSVYYVHHSSCWKCKVLIVTYVDILRNIHNLWVQRLIQTCWYTNWYIHAGSSVYSLNY